jgi:hypothetical protein
MKGFGFFPGRKLPTCAAFGGAKPSGVFQCLLLRVNTSVVFLKE